VRLGDGGDHIARDVDCGRVALCVGLGDNVSDLRAGTDLQHRVRTAWPIEKRTVAEAQTVTSL